MNPDKLKAQLMVDEGWRDKPYIDTKGNITIGYGHKELHDVMIDADGTISQEYGLQLLERDINRTVLQLNILLPWWVNLDDARQDVMVDMGFNLGLHGLMEFHVTLDCLKTAQFDKAAVAMLDSDWAAQVGKRAVRLSEIVRTGKEPNDGSIDDGSNSLV